ncbi:MAG: DinB family protein [Bryobacteraceae bacterium]
MEYHLESTTTLLGIFPGTLNALVRDLPEALVLQGEGENTMNVFEVVGHLINAERTNWMPRIRFLLEFGETRTFEVFDRQPPDAGGMSLGQLLDEFARLRAESISALHALKLSPEDFEKRGLHPTFGAVTLSELLATWATHDLTHLHQISRVLAYQYRDAVGPWRRFLGVLQCDGHSGGA